MQAGNVTLWKVYALIALCARCELGSRCTKSSFVLRTRPRVPIPEPLYRSPAEACLLLKPPRGNVLQDRSHPPFPRPAPQVRVRVKHFT